jgi:fatty acid desaturase
MIDQDEIEHSLKALKAHKRRERRIRYLTVFSGIAVLACYAIIGLLSGYWGIGLALVPFALMLIIIGVIGIVVARVSGLD